MPARLPFEGASNSIEYDIGRPGPVRSEVAGSGENTASIRRAEDIPMERIEAVGQRHGSPAIFRKLESDNEGRMENREEEQKNKPGMPKTAGELNVLLKRANFARALLGQSPSMPVAGKTVSPGGTPLIPPEVAQAARRAMALEAGYRGKQRTYGEKMTDALGLSAAASALKGLGGADPDVLAEERNPLKRLGLRLTAAKSALQGAKSRAAVDRATEQDLREARKNLIGRQGVMTALTARGGVDAPAGRTESPLTGSMIHPGDVIKATSGQNEILIRRSTGQPVLQDASGKFYAPAPGTMEHNIAVSSMENLTPKQVHELKVQLGQRQDSPFNKLTATLADLNTKPAFHILSMLGPLALNYIPAGQGRTAADTKLGKAFQYGMMGTQLASLLSGATTRNPGAGLGRNFTSGTSGL
jgi:hypothetical protein